MKYVIYKKRHQLIPLIFPDHVNHDELIIKGAELYSAGFLSVDVNSLVEVMESPSESLKIGPKEGDREILQNLIWNAGMMPFVIFDDI